MILSFWLSSYWLPHQKVWTGGGWGDFCLTTVWGLSGFTTAFTCRYTDVIIMHDRSPLLTLLSFSRQMRNNSASTCCTNTSKADDGKKKTLSEANYKLRKAKSLVNHSPFIISAIWLWPPCLNHREIINGDKSLETASSRHHALWNSVCTAGGKLCWWWCLREGWRRGWNRGHCCI